MAPQEITCEQAPKLSGGDRAKTKIRPARQFFFSPYTPLGKLCTGYTRKQHLVSLLPFVHLHMRKQIM